MKKESIKILQIGKENWKHFYQVSEKLVWDFLHEDETDSILKEIEENNKKTKDEIDEIDKLLEEKANEEIEGQIDIKFNYDVVIFSEKNIECIKKFEDNLKVYRIIYDINSNLTKDIENILENKFAYGFNYNNKQKLIDKLEYMFYGKSSYGAMQSIKNLNINNKYLANTTYQGNIYAEVEQDFGKEYQQVASWKYDFDYRNKVQEFWPEYRLEGNCQLKIKIYSVRKGSMSEIVKVEEYEGKDLDELLIFESTEDTNVSLVVSVLVKGKGKVKLGPLHCRDSRLGIGSFFPGGKRLVDANRQEIFYYFDPADFKPPLNVYFSGYKTLEGFEGYGFIKHMGAPFLLIAEPRIEGGGFYMGSEEYENNVKDIISSALEWLGFNNDDLILAGLSMGTFGALYYGSMLKPHSILVGKPLVNIGDIAKNEKLIRPEGFPTSLDILRSMTGGITNEHIEELNNRFWKKFNIADFSDTTIVVSYMKHDDYDATAYYDILDSFNAREGKIISKGIEGRHNDNTSAIVNWFITQFNSILKNDFERN